MSCHDRMVMFLVATVSACVPSTGDSSGSGPAGGETSTGAPGTTDGQPTTTGADTTAADPTTDEATTGEATTTTSTTESTTGSTTGEPGACEVVQGDHRPACRGRACAIVLDLEFRCEGNDFATLGMGVALAPDATWFVHSNYYGGLLFRAEADGAEQVDGVIDGYTDVAFLMTQGQGGAPHIAHDVSKGPNGGEGLRHVALVDGVWTDAVLTDTEFLTMPYSVLVDGQSRPHILHDGGDGPDTSVAVLDGGTWTSHIADSQVYATQMVFGPNDAEIFVGALEYQLQAFVGGQPLALGSSFPQSSRRYQAAGATKGPVVAAALQLGDALEVAWGPAPDAVEIAGTGPLGNACDYIDVDGPDDPCGGPCHDESVGMVPEAFAFARTADGVGWLAWVVTHRDTDGEYHYFEIEGDPFCAPDTEHDDSVGVLHLARVPLGAGAPTEVLTLPVPDIVGGLADDGYPIRRSPVVLAAFGDDLALALRLRGEPSDGQRPPYGRLLRIDTTSLP